MFFSVVVPTHKRKQQLSRLLDSLQQQTFNKDSFEVLVIATENDESLSLDVKNWDINLQLIEFTNDPLDGKSAASKRNLGVKKSQSQWIAFIDDDCIADSRWLESAKKEIEVNSPDLIEGSVVIPEPKHKTFTYKGLKRLSDPGGYQTCNMFYRKEVFNEIGGFDLHFPFYLEDTDLAWSLIEKNKKATFSHHAKVLHPVPPPQPKRLWDQALRTKKLVYFYKKHPQLFKESRMRFFSRAYLIILCLDLLLILSLLFDPIYMALFFSLKLTVTLAYVFKMYRGCHFSFSEVAKTYFYLLFSPSVALVLYIRGSLKHSVLPPIN